MRSSRSGRGALFQQRGFSLVEALIGSAILGVALVVLLGALGSVVIGARVAERKVVEERLARNAIETEMAQPFPGQCPVTSTTSVDGAVYTTQLTCSTLSSNLVEYRASVRDSSGAAMSLTLDRAMVQ
jgi:prepilin-type N-terminal cleavage/methylation domain-containing protein